MRILDIAMARAVVASDKWAARIQPDAATGCVIWTGNRDTYGYGQIWVGGRQVLAHRMSWVAEGGAQVEGMELDHICRVRACVNHQHLELVTHAVNVMRGESPTALNARKTHCPQGHELSGDNLVPYYKQRGVRACAVCRTQRARESRDLLRAAAAALGLTQDEYARRHGRHRSRMLAHVAAVIDK